jgi:hypothetical protein
VCWLAARAPACGRDGQEGGPRWYWGGGSSSSSWRKSSWTRGASVARCTVAAERSMCSGHHHASLLLLLACTTASTAAGIHSTQRQLLPNTDWRDCLVARFPLREPPEATNLSSCVGICGALPECVAVAWNPAMGQAQCQLKCAARPAQRFFSPNCTGVIVRPNSTSCPLPTYHPPAWDADIAAGTLLLAGPAEPAGHVGNGYVAAYIVSPPGSSGPTVSGVEHIAGVYAGKRLDNPPHTWPNKDCDTWCDRAHRVDLPSFSSTASISTIGGRRSGIATASGQDLGRSAYYLVHRVGAITCLQRTYAHRGQMHLLNTEFECTNTGAAAVIVELSEPGPSMMPLRGGGMAKAAPMGEVQSNAVDSAMPGVTCSRVRVRVPEKKNGTCAVVGECHTQCDGRTFSVSAGTTQVVSCVSARHSSIDQDRTHARVHTDPVALAKQSWAEANATAATLWASHVAAQRTLLIPGIEVTGNPALAAVINVTVEAMLAAYRRDAFPGAGSGGLAADAYAGATGMCPARDQPSAYILLFIYYLVPDRFV